MFGIIYSSKGKVPEMKRLRDERRFLWEHLRWDRIDWRIFAMPCWTSGQAPRPRNFLASVCCYTACRSQVGVGEGGMPPANALPPAHQCGAAGVCLFIWYLQCSWRSCTWLLWILGEHEHSIYSTYLFETPSNLYRKAILDLMQFKFSILGSLIHNIWVNDKYQIYSCLS